MFWFNLCSFPLLCTHIKGELLTDFDSTTATINSEGVYDYNFLGFTPQKLEQSDTGD